MSDKITSVMSSKPEIESINLFEKYKKELDEFEKWIQSQPRLPQNIDKMLLLRFLNVCEYDVEKAQKLLVFNLEIRKSNPEIFLNRDLLGEEFQRASKTIQIIPLGKDVTNTHTISIFRLADSDPNVYDPIGITRHMHAFFDACFAMSIDDGCELPRGDIGISDLKGFSFRHMWRFMKNMSTLSGHMKYVQEALPSAIVENHFINMPGIFNHLFSIMKQFMKQEVIDTMKFHTNIETLYDYIPREILPNEYGGAAGRCDDLNEAWMKKVMEKREYIENDDNWKLND